VADGESLLIGGYEYERSETATSQVPLLGDIPYVGALFRSKQATSQRLERLILITPRLKRINGEMPRTAAAEVAVDGVGNVANGVAAAAPAALAGVPVRTAGTDTAVTGALLSLTQPGVPQPQPARPAPYFAQPAQEGPR
jgi:type III secretion protein C